MSYMKEVALLIEEARTYGVSLDVSDFKTVNGKLKIHGISPEDWFNLAECYYGKDGE